MRRLSTIAFVAMLLVTCVLIFSMPTTITNVSAVITNGVGVYWDSDCSDEVLEIPWGVLNPGSSKNEVVYIQNQEDKPIFLIMSTTNWDPSNASKYITLTWNYGVRMLDPDVVLQITLTLSVSRYIRGISNFSFSILVTGNQRFLGDVDGDGYVGPSDVWFYMAPAYGTYVGDSNYDPNCDFDLDGYVGPTDFWIYLMPFYGKDWTS